MIESIMYLTGMSRPELFKNMAILLVIIVLIWSILRELRTWYWKINERVVLLNEINDNLKDIKEHLIEK